MSEFKLSEERKKLFNAYRKRGVPSSFFLLLKSQDKEFIKRLKETKYDILIIGNVLKWDEIEDIYAQKIIIKALEEFRKRIDKLAGDLK